MLIMSSGIQRKTRSTARMKTEHFANLKVGSTIVFPTTKVIWKVESVVERGAVLFRADNGSHKHLAEWLELALAEINSP